MSRAAALVGIVAAAAACGPRPAPGGVTSRDAIVKLTSNVPEAQVYVDGRFIAPVSMLRGGVAVEPGVHRFEVRHEGHFSRYLELTLTRAQRTTVALDLAPILP